ARVPGLGVCPCSVPLFTADPRTPPTYTLSLHDALPISLASCPVTIRRKGAPLIIYVLPNNLRRNRRASRRTNRRCSRARTSCCRSEEHTSELQSRENLVCRLLLEKKKRPAPRVATAGPT